MNAPSPLSQNLDAAWTIACAMLVYFMHGGFGFYEAGMCHRKNTVDTLAHNLIVLAITLIVYWALGFGLMFGDGGPLVGAAGFAPSFLGDGRGAFAALSDKPVAVIVAFAFAMSFADTPATLIAGTGAERIRLEAVVILTVVISGFVFPVIGHWVIGGGWLARLSRPVYDTGSGIVHLCGGCCALAVAVHLGPRRGVFRLKVHERAPSVSSMPMVFLGAFILWLGFFAFNAGFAMKASQSIGLVVANTALAGGFGAVVTMAGARLITGKAELRATIVGLLTANVAVTSSSAVIAPWAAALIGALAGLATLGALRGWAALGIDDPTEYLTMNVVGGALGLLAVGLFADPAIVGRFGASPAPGPGLWYGGAGQFWTQLVAAGVIAAFALAVASAACAVLGWTGHMRVTEEEEREGSDRATHGETADGNRSEPEP